MKLKLAGSRSSDPWNMSDLDWALSDLKTNKSRDHEGLINEIFKKEVIGKNLNDSLLLMFNQIEIVDMFMIILIVKEPIYIG